MRSSVYALSDRTLSCKVKELEEGLGRLKASLDKEKLLSSTAQEKLKSLQAEAEEQRQAADSAEEVVKAHQSEILTFISCGSTCLQRS